MKNMNENYLRLVLSFLSMIFILYIGSTLLNRAKFDFTEEGLYTLSPGSKSLLAKLDSPIKLKLYYSKTAANKGSEGLRQFNNHYTYVRELISEFVARSRNQLSLEVIDPRPDTPEEEDALAYGLRKFHLSETERYFFGLVAENESGTEKIIEFFDPGQRDKLEYDIAKLIYTVQNPQKKVLGVISSLDIINDEINPYMAQILRMQGKEAPETWATLKMAEEFYTVRKIERDAEKISGVDTLAVIHPTGFPEKTLFAIDQFLMSGGHLVVFVDPNAVVGASSGPYAEPSSSPDAGFKRLMDKWGIELKPNEYVGDKYLSGVARYNHNQPATRVLGLLNCNQACSQGANEPITAGLDKITFVYPGHLVVKKTEDVEAKPLLFTTDRGNTYKAVGFELNSPPSLWRKFTEGVKPVPLAYRLSGQFSSAFPEGLKTNHDSKNLKNSEDKPEVTTKTKKLASIVVFPDVDFISNQFAFKNSFLGLALANNNSSLFLNSVEAVSGDVDLMSIRSKGSINRSFDVIEQIEFEAEKKTATKVNQINASISKFQAELNELGKKANQGNIALLQNEGLKKKKELSKKIALLKKELREAKREGREKVEGLGKALQYLNTLFSPLLVILFSFWYSRKRRQNLITIDLETPSENKLRTMATTGGQA
jgi:ABC-2 type transport system permease protein